MGVALFSVASEDYQRVRATPNVPANRYAVPSIGAQHGIFRQAFRHQALKRRGALVQHRLRIKMNRRKPLVSAFVTSLKIRHR